MSKVFKGEVLLFTLLFLATSQVAHSAVGYWWHLGLLLYLFGTAIYFTLLLFEEGSAIMAWATSLFAFVCLLITIAYSSDLIFIFGSVRTAATLAAYALLIFTHTLSQIYFADRPFSLRHEMKQFLAYGVFATLATGLLSLSGIMIITDIQFYSTAFLLFAFIMAFQTVFTQIVAAADISRRFYRGSKYDPDRKRV